MSDYLNEDLFKFNNDASASSFGWNFQSNAGIFLFLKYLPEAEDIKIESKLQDIEITLLNGSKILAQAKSAQDFTICKDKKEKFKDALISLSRNPQKNNSLIYISNIPDTFKSASGFFNNCIVPYTSCLSGVKTEIDSTFNSIINSINKSIVKVKNKNKKAELLEVKEKIENFDKNSLLISSITPYFGEDQNRYIVISDAVLDFLINCINLNRDDAISIRQRLLEHWQLKLEHNSTIKDNMITKKITKLEFAWPIAALLIDGDFPDIKDCLTFIPDQSLTNEVLRLMNTSTSIYHERFAFTNLVLQEYEQFKKDLIGQEVSQVEKQFIIKRGYLFENEFAVSGDMELTEYLTKAFIYKIIINNRNMQKISSGVGIKI